MDWRDRTVSNPVILAALAFAAALLHEEDYIPLPKLATASRVGQ